MTRTLDQLDAAFNTLNGQFTPLRDTTIPGHTKDIADIRAQLGNLPQPGQGQTVAERLDAIDKKLADMAAMIKLDRMLFLGYAVAGALIKVDVQLIKFDLTILKKIDEKNVALLKRPIAALQKGFTALTSVGDGSVYQKVKELISKKAAEERRQREAEKKRKQSHDERLKKHIEGLPKKVAINTRDIDKLFSVLRSAGQSARAARDDRSGLAPNHKGVDAKKPTIGPVSKDVRNLRSAVDDLIASLGSL
jgi:hypothetical protein